MTAPKNGSPDLPDIGKFINEKPVEDDEGSKERRDKIGEKFLDKATKAVMEIPDKFLEDLLKRRGNGDPSALPQGPGNVQVNVQQDNILTKELGRLQLTTIRVKSLMQDYLKPGTSKEHVYSFIVNNFDGPYQHKFLSILNDSELLPLDAEEQLQFLEKVVNVDFAEIDKTDLRRQAERIVKERMENSDHKGSNHKGYFATFFGRNKNKNVAPSEAAIEEKMANMLEERKRFEEIYKNGMAELLSKGDVKGLLKYVNKIIEILREDDKNALRPYVSKLRNKERYLDNSATENLQKTAGAYLNECTSILDSYMNSSSGNGK